VIGDAIVVCAVEYKLREMFYRKKQLTYMAGTLNN
jgi:hypothetical protein